MRPVFVWVVVFTIRQGRLEALLARRAGNLWSLPGDAASGGATLMDAAVDALARQTGVRGIGLEQLYTIDHPEPGQGIVVGYLALISADRHPVSPGADEVEVRWFPLGDLPALQPAQVEVLAYGRERLRAKTAYAPIAVQLLPEAFTMGELQAVYEAVLDMRLDARNFRRDVLAARVVEPVGRQRREGPGRPAELYRSAGGQFAVVANERRIARLIGHPHGDDRHGIPGGAGRGAW